MKKLNLKLYAGLGNQLFQLSIAFFIAKKYDYKLIAVDRTYCIENQKHNYLLSLFDLNNISGLDLDEPSLIFLARLPKILDFKLRLNPLISDKNINFFLKKDGSSASLFLDGYFIASQTQEIFLEGFSAIKASYKFQNLNLLSPQDSCIIHIRGTDFLKLGWNSVCPREYYAASINKMVSNNVKSFKIVTDDVAYSKIFIRDLGIDAEIVGGSVVDDFNIIAHSHNRILSSSTYAFWAAAVGTDLHGPVGMTIAPRKWTPDLPRLFLLPGELNVNHF